MVTTTSKSKKNNGKAAATKRPSVRSFDRSYASVKGLPSIGMPYQTKLSFAPLLRYWESLSESENIAENLMAREIMERAKNFPELWKPIEDESLLDLHRETVELLMAGIFPLALRDTQLGKATKPFDMQAFYLTPAMCNMTEGCNVKVKFDKKDEFLSNTLIHKACAAILNACYGQSLEVDPLVIFTVEPEDRRIQHYFKALLNTRFMDVVPVKPLKPLSQEEINRLYSNIYDLDAWMEALPPENFELHGIVGMDLIDVTKEETISRLRFHLLEKDAVVKAENIQRMESLLKTYFGLPDLRLGIMAVDYPADRKNEFKYKIRHCFLAHRHDCLLDPENAYSVYDKALKYRELLLIEDLQKLTHKTSIEQDLIRAGFRSYMVAPLISKEDKIIGLIELGSPQAYQLNSFTERDFRSMIPLFNIAVERSREETDNRIEAIIREQFTAIHPSVEWRFVEAAFNYLEKTNTQGKREAIDSIAFNEVHPLYAQADIVNSSNIRNQAIQEDFVKNLELVRDILKLANQEVDFPLLQYYLFETEHLIEHLHKELRSSDESLVIDFILREIHPLLEEAAKRNTYVGSALNNYYSQLDPHFGVLYQKRKDYEESVARINMNISDFLEKEDERTQKMIPHYFEKYKTDGVQFEVYAGQSLLRREEFNHLHLRNLRLWQLNAMVEITRNMENLRADLPMPLQTAQLIFVYGQPISIRFRADDKRFDVDGAYNIRYEIIKKRIDKAMITLPDGSRERLTQAGKVAIVYASEKDREEYINYLNSLKRQNLIEDEVEELELEKLQGVQGLKALRVQVK